MKKYSRVTAGRRFLAYYVDYFLIGVIINSAYYLFIDNKIKMLTEQYISAYSNSTGVGLMNVFENLQKLPACNFVFNSLIILEIVRIIISLLYFIILPLFWKKQTVGRALAKIKLVKKNNEEVTVFNLIRRQVIGRLIFKLASVVLIGLIVEIISVFDSKPTTIEDGFGGTMMIDLELEIKDISEV